MPFFSSRTPYDDVVEKATPSETPQNDGVIISRFFPVSDKINECAPGSKAKTTACSECLRSVWRRVKHQDPLIGLHAVSLLDFLIKNCGVQFMAALDDRDFVLKMKDFLKVKLEDKQQQHKQVAESLKARIQEWAETEMKHVTWFPVGPMEERRKERSNVRGLYNIMRRQGYSFPILRVATPATDAASSSSPSTMPTTTTTTTPEATVESELERREREELDRAIQASLLDSPPSYEDSVGRATSPSTTVSEGRPLVSLYPGGQLVVNSGAVPKSSPATPSAPSASPSLLIRCPTTTPPQQQQQRTKTCRALYDFESMESDELTLRTDDVVLVTDAKDVHWWRGRNVTTGKEGLFPASFVEDEKIAAAKREKSPRTEMKKQKTATPPSTATTTTPRPRIDGEKIKRALHLIQQIDPAQARDPEAENALRELEAECLAMGSLIDQELQATDKRHLAFLDLNKRLSNALQMYHYLMINEKDCRANVQGTSQAPSL